MSVPTKGDDLVFFVNGQKVTEAKPDPECTLLQYLRRSLLLPGTKEGCGHGGCGSCTVMLSRYDGQANSLSYTVNACLFPLCAVHGLAVTTVEGVGNPRTGLHEVQRRLIESHGLQCGFCTPGFVMSAFTLLRNKPTPTKNELESAIEGNLCRCTGYRPIAEAFKPLTKEHCPMGEDCCQNQPQTSSSEQSEDTIQPLKNEQVAIFPPELKLSDQYRSRSVVFKGKRWTWIQPASLNELLTLKDKYRHAPVIMGNTTALLLLKMGKFEATDVLLYGGNVRELKKMETTDTGLVLGAALTLNELGQYLKTVTEQIEDDKKRHLGALQDMVRKYGADQVRNVATLSGSILSNRSNSDIITLFIAAGARMTVSSVAGERTIPIDAALDDSEVIVSVHIPFSSQVEHLMFFKHSDRQTFSLARLNAGMFVCLNKEQKVADLRLCFGGIGRNAVLASACAESARGRVWNEDLLDHVITAMTDDLTADSKLPADDHRLAVAVSFFFRFYLTVQRNEPGGVSLAHSMLEAIDETPLLPCEGTQFYDPCTDENQPTTDSVGRPVMNVASESIVSGEAVFFDDIPRYEGELFFAPVTSTRAHARILSVDTSKALALEGVHSYVDHKDVQGTNMFGFAIVDEELFASKEVHCYGQMIGGILADTREMARKAAYLVQIEYEDLEAILTFEEAIERESFHPKETQLRLVDGDAEAALRESDVIIEGECLTAPQEHFYMETLGALAVPISESDELEVYTPTQALDLAQETIARFVNKPSHKVVARIKRVGGSFGGKETRYVFVSGAAAVAAVKTRRPVRFVLSRETDMLMTGKRNPLLGKYKVGVSRDGRLKGLQLKVYVNAGHALDHGSWILRLASVNIENVVKIPNIHLQGFVCRTNHPCYTAFRGYGQQMANLILEDMLYKVSFELGIPQDKVREINLFRQGDSTPYHQLLKECTIRQLWKQCQEESDYEDRKKAIENFNREHRWKKRGLAMTGVKFGIGYGPTVAYQGAALVHIYKDGSVRLAHGGVESGQGLFTKMIQVASRVLGIPMDKIFTSETSTALNANMTATGGSMGTDLFGRAVMDACNILRERLEPLRELNPQQTWEKLISTAYMQRVKLSAYGFSRQKKEKTFDYENMTGQYYDYYTYGAGCSEVEIDVLTGEHQLLRTDIVMDVGKSLNPAIDIGQIEGGFVQGMGMVTTEETGIGKKGEVTTCSPLSYKIPNIRSIPRTFNVTFMKNHDVVNTVYSSKGIGEPPLMLSISVLMAIREAVRAARADTGLHDYCSLDTPATAAKIRTACGTQLQGLKKL